MQEAFEMVKTRISNEAMLAHADFSKPFDVHMDSSDYQLGGIVSQEGKPIAFFSKKLNWSQKKYPITEKELLSITETLKEFNHTSLYWSQEPDTWWYKAHMQQSFATTIFAWREQFYVKIYWRG